MLRLTALLAAVSLGCVPPGNDSGKPFGSTDAGSDAAQEQLAGEFEVLEYVEETSGSFMHYPRTEGGCFHSLEGILSLNNSSGKNSGNYYLLLETQDSCTVLVQTIELYDVYGVREDTDDLVLQVPGIGFLEFDYWWKEAKLFLKYPYWNQDDPATVVLMKVGEVGECLAGYGHCFESPSCKGMMLYSCMLQDTCLEIDGGFKEHAAGHAGEMCISYF